MNNGKDDLGKFDPRSHDGVFFGYSSTSKAYRVFNKRIYYMEESVHFIYNESGSVEDLGNKDDVELEELLYLWRDSLNKDLISTKRMEKMIKN